MSGIPVHGRWCGSKTYPTVCRYCSDPVFYFQCNCGCKVFFDDLGDPWPRHECAEYLATISPLKFTVESTYTATLRQNLRKPKAFRIIRVDAKEADTVDDLGVIRELLREVDILAKSGVAADEHLGMALLGKLARTPHGQITIHTGDLSQGDLKSFTFYIETRLIDRLRLQRRQIVSVRLRSQPIPWKQGATRAVWVCKEIVHP